MTKREAKSKEYFAKLGRVEKAIAKGGYRNSELLEFWKGLVRNSSGRWTVYYHKGVKYFKYGKQPEPDLNDEVQVALM